jgi:hypothetical protein
LEFAREFFDICANSSDSKDFISTVCLQKTLSAIGVPVPPNFLPRVFNVAQAGATKLSES